MVVEVPTDVACFEWVDEGETITITKFLESNYTEIVIPSTIEGKPVTKITNGAEVFEIVKAIP